MADSGHKTDVFPSQIHDSSAIKKLPKDPIFKDIMSNFEIFPFIIFLDGKHVYYKRVAWNSRYEKHFQDTGTSYLKSQNAVEEKSWSSAAKKLRKDCSDNLRKNIDSRTGFKYNYNYFLVKCCFTLGQRQVEPGTCHLYQIGAVQMVLYFLDKLAQLKIKFENKSFPVDKQFQFSKRFLRPRQNYFLPEGTVYVLYAVNKSFFSVHILKSDAPLPFPATNPLYEASSRPDPVDYLYRRPVATPMIEEAVLEDSVGPTRDPQEPCSSTAPLDDPVLLQLDSGRLITENMLMPPPPAPTHHVITIASIPIDKTVKVVSPDIVQWYHDRFKYKEYTYPKEQIVDLGLCDPPLDLTYGEPLAMNPLPPEPLVEHMKEKESLAMDSLPSVPDSPTDSIDSTLDWVMNEPVKVRQEGVQEAPFLDDIFNLEIPFHTEDEIISELFNDLENSVEVTDAYLNSG